MIKKLVFLEKNNNENDYKNFKSFMSNDDLFLEEIVKLMKLNNH